MKLCECGCGQSAPIAKKNDGRVKSGQVRRYIKGHNQRVVSLEQLRDRTFINADGCWIWQGAKDHGGYGFFGRPRKSAHRFSYELAKGPIPVGLQIDHLCRQPACVNPDHLEAVTNQENIRRGLKGVLTTHCPHGHPYDEKNTYYRKSGARLCRACALAAYHRKKAVA